jgi:hypothetical protein
LEENLHLGISIRHGNIVENNSGFIKSLVGYQEFWAFWKHHDKIYCYNGTYKDEAVKLIPILVVLEVYRMNNKDSAISDIRGCHGHSLELLWNKFAHVIASHSNSASSTQTYD